MIGLDRSAKLLEHSAARARLMELANCHFERDDVHALSRPSESADAVLVSRLFMMLSDRVQALGEIHRVLRLGGACFLAEPRSPWRAAIPLHAMWAMVYLLALCGGASPRSYGERRNPVVLTDAEFAGPRRLAALEQGALLAGPTLPLRLVPQVTGQESPAAVHGVPSPQAPGVRYFVSAKSARYWP